MAVIWSIILVVYSSFEAAPAIAWLLLIPFIYQDLYDGVLRRKR